VARKAGPAGKMTLSMGFGFIEVDREEIAKAVVKEKQGSMLDGHKLSLQLSKSSASAAVEVGKNKSKRKGHESLLGDEEGGLSKLVVRNVAFEATRKDIVALFAPFGHLKSCRLPKKFDGSHRGFAFVEFITRQEARNATEGLTGTHLYGRRLVVEVAEEDPQETGDVESLRAKTGSQFAKRAKREFDAEKGHKGKGQDIFPGQDMDMD
jgi:multiple RNA-binding domain-containing protein 1